MATLLALPRGLSRAIIAPATAVVRASGSLPCAPPRPLALRRWYSSSNPDKAPYREVPSYLEKTFKGNMDGRIRLLRCGPDGFRAEIGDNPVAMKGSIAVLPHSVLEWKVSGMEDITAESLALFPIYQPPIEILVIGTGKSMRLLDPKVREFCRSKGLMVEVCGTRNAMAAYNFLAGEGRTVAAALLVEK